MDIQTLNNIKQRFEDKFELHEVGKEIFTVCTNLDDSHCNGGFEVEASEEEAVREFLSNVWNFIQEEIQKLESDK